MAFGQCRWVGESGDGRTLVEGDKELVRSGADGDAPGMPTNSELYFISSPTMPTASITV